MLLVNECGIAPEKLTSILHYDGTPVSARFITREIGEKARLFNVAPLRNATSSQPRRGSLRPRRRRARPTGRYAAGEEAATRRLPK